jgi:hypothetical protein
MVVRVGPVTAILLLCGIGAPLRAADCNGNRVEDFTDIADATSNDCNTNGIPDECDALLLPLGQRRQRLSIGENPLGLVVVDLDGDGAGELVAVTSGTALSVARGDGNGGFERPVDYPAGDGARALTAGDLDADGDRDLVTVSDTAFFLLRNPGDGTLGRAEEFAAPPGTGSVTMADLNGDGLLDLVTASTSTHRVSVHVNGGAGAFAAEVSFSVGEGPATVAAGDFDDDGDVDLASANQTAGTVSVLINQGPGDQGAASMAAAVAYEVGPLPPPTAVTGELLAAGDLDGDDDLELVVATSASVAVLANQGGGTFAEAAHFAAKPIALTLGDLDADGDTDVAIGSELTTQPAPPLSPGAADIRHAGLLTVIANDGGGRLLAASSFSLEASARFVTAADLDADGDLELAVVTGDPEGVSVFWSGQEDTYAMSVQHVIFQDASPHGVAVADLDGDGDMDMASSNGGQFRSYTILINEGGGVFRIQPAVLVGGTAHIYTIAVGDFDLDGDLDLSFADLNNHLVHVVLNDGTAKFSPPASFRTGREPFYCTVGDMDSDGDLDVITADKLSRSATVLFNDGSAGFEQRERVRTGEGPQGVVAGDFDADGNMDLAVANSGAARSERLSVHRGAGDGTFGAAENYSTSAGPAFVQAGDFDADGDVDLASAQRDSTASVFPNRGDGTFDSPSTILLAENAFSFLAVDINGSGHLDFVFANQGGGNISVLLNQGQGTFRPPFHYAAAGLPRYVAAGDLDGDGYSDIVCNNRIGNSLTMFFNRSPRGGRENVPEGICISDGEPQFRRGDVDASGARNVTDALSLLNYLFLRGSVPPCRASADADDSGRLNLVDVLSLLNHLFQNGGPLPPPFEQCAEDPSADDLDCRSFPACP